jgi:hypothetical protein
VTKNSGFWAGGGFVIEKEGIYKIHIRNFINLLSENVLVGAF